jgi:nucleoside-diphosphate-sugar epimerase
MSLPLVALTGATGFSGRHLLKELPKRGYKIRVLLRRPTMLPSEASGAVVGDFAAPRNMSDARAICRERGAPRTWSRGRRTLCLHVLLNANFCAAEHGRAIPFRET